MTPKINALKINALKINKSKIDKSKIDKHHTGVILPCHFSCSGPAKAGQPQSRPPAQGNANGSAKIPLFPPLLFYR
jgi:hypothetical protein